MRKNKLSLATFGILSAALLGACAVEAPVAEETTAPAFLHGEGWEPVAEGVWFRQTSPDGGELFGAGLAGAEWLREQMATELAAPNRGDEEIAFYAGIRGDAEAMLDRLSAGTGVVSKSACLPSTNAGPRSPGAQSGASIWCPTAQGLTTRALARTQGVTNQYYGPTYGTSSGIGAWRDGTWDCYAEAYASSASGYWHSSWYSGCY